VVLINHAGGVGKTTLVRDIGAQLARYGQRVLLIDVDPQHNLTEWLDIDWTAVRREDTILHAVGAYFGNDDERPSLPEPRPVPGFDGYTLDIIPSGDEMMRLDSEIQAQMGPGLYRLRQALDELETRHTYDFILIDSPPYFSAITTLCLNATNNVVIPASTDLKGITAIRRVINYIAGVRNTSNPDLTIRLIVPTKYQPNTVSGQEGLKAMRSIADDVAPVATPARHGVAYNEAQALHAPIPMLNDRNARAVQPDLRAITEELLDAFHVTIDVDVPAEAARER
jgi:chromosome partitioning protein